MYQIDEVQHAIQLDLSLEAKRGVSSRYDPYEIHELCDGLGLARMIGLEYRPKRQFDIRMIRLKMPEAQLV